MKNFLIIYLLTAISAFAGLSFSSMEEGDRVEITFHSTGCFHNNISYYEIRKTGDTTFFTQYAIIWDKSVPAKMIEKKAIGQLKLTKEDVDGLDALLRYYRGKKESGSTTFVSLLVEYYEGTRQIGVEQLSDPSGGFDLRNKLDATSFDKLTARFHR